MHCICVLDYLMSLQILNYTLLICNEHIMAVCIMEGEKGTVRWGSAPQDGSFRVFK